MFTGLHVTPTFLRPGMTVESSMKRWLIFSRLFRSAMMWSCEYGAAEEDAEILAEALLVGGESDPRWVICGTTPPHSAVAAAEFGCCWGSVIISCAAAAADAELKSQQLIGLLLLVVPLLVQLLGAAAVAHMAVGDQPATHAPAPPLPLPLSVSTELQLLAARWPSRAGGSPGTKLSTSTDAAAYPITGNCETVSQQPVVLS